MATDNVGIVVNGQPHSVLATSVSFEHVGTLAGYGTLAGLSIVVQIPPHGISFVLQPYGTIKPIEGMVFNVYDEQHLRSNA